MFLLCQDGAIEQLPDGTSPMDCFSQGPVLQVEAHACTLSWCAASWGSQLQSVSEVVGLSQHMLLH